MSNPLHDCTDEPLFGEVLFTYTRAQALEDGVLVDAGPLAQEAGFGLPVALTAAAWTDCVAWNEADCLAQVHQDETGRLWDVLFMAAHAVRSDAGHGSSKQFELYRVPRDGHSIKPTKACLKLVVGPDDHGDAVVTLMLPGED